MILRHELFFLSKEEKYSHATRISFNSTITSLVGRPCMICFIYILEGLFSRWDGIISFLPSHTNPCLQLSVCNRFIFHVCHWSIIFREQVESPCNASAFFLRLWYFSSVISCLSAACPHLYNRPPENLCDRFNNSTCCTRAAWRERVFFSSCWASYWQPCRQFPLIRWDP